MIVIAGIIEFDSSKRKILDDAFETMRAATLQEEGGHEYQCYVSRTEPGTAFLFEKWLDEDALAAHLQSSHIAAFRNAFVAIGVSRTDIQKYSGATEGPVR